MSSILESSNSAHTPLSVLAGAGIITNEYQLCLDALHALLSGCRTAAAVLFRKLRRPALRKKLLSEMSKHGFMPIVPSSRILLRVYNWVTSMCKIEQHRAANIEVGSASLDLMLQFIASFAHDDSRTNLIRFIKPSSSDHSSSSVASRSDLEHADYKILRRMFCALARLAYAAFFTPRSVDDGLSLSGL